MTLSRNLLAGFGSSAATTVVGLVVVPLYLRYLGVEGYGLIGFFATTQALFQVLDLGLSPTLSREVARARAEGDPHRAPRLLHTLATVYWGTAVLIAVALAAAGPAIARGWLQSRHLAPGTVSDAVVLMALIIGCRWPTGIYLGAIVGAERLTIASGLAFANALVGSVGAVAVIALVSRSIQAFFIWQAIVGLAYALSMRWAAWSVIGRAPAVRFAFGDLRRLWRFSAAMGGIAIAGLALAQADKVLLSRILELEAFGGYMVASMLAGGLYILIVPVFNGVYPRFSHLVASGDHRGLSALYRTATRLVGAAIFPVAMLLVVSGEDFVGLWTRDPPLASAIAPVLGVLAAGTALHGVMHLPYALQLAYGKARMALWIAVTLLVLMVPLVLVLASRYGALGGGMAWLAVQVVYVALGTWMTHRQLLVGHGGSWLLKEVGVPLAISVGVGVAGHLLLRTTAWTPLVKAASGIGLATLASALSFAASPQLSNAVLENLGWRKPPQPPGSAPLPGAGEP